MQTLLNKLDSHKSYCQTAPEDIDISCIVASQFDAGRIVTLNESISNIHGRSQGSSCH